MVASATSYRVTSWTTIRVVNATTGRLTIVALGRLRLLLGMLLFLLDALSAIGEGEALIFLFKLFFLGLLPVVLLLAY